MAKKTDPLAGWKKSVTPTPEAESTFRKLEKVLRALDGAAFLGQAQKFPPKYILDVSAKAPLHRGKRFASLAAVGDTIYFELIELDEAHKRRVRAALKGAKFNSYEGFEITRFSDAIVEKVSALLHEAAEQFQQKHARAQKVTPYQAKAIHPLPHSVLWTAPLSWTAPKAAASSDYSSRIPANAVFTRGEIIFTLAKSKGVGIQSWSEQSLPALIELEPSKKRQSPPLVVAAHAIGFDGKAWSFRLVKNKSQAFMPLFVGDDHQHQSLAPPELFKAFPIERVEIQSVLSLGSGKAIRISLTSDFAIELDDDFDQFDDE